MHLLYKQLGLCKQSSEDICHFKRILSARRRPTVLPTSRMLSSCCCPSWRSPTSSRGKTPQSREELASGATFTTRSRRRRLLRVSSGGNVCGRLTSVVRSLFPHQQPLLWLLPLRPLLKTFRCDFFLFSSTGKYDKVFILFQPGIENMQYYFHSILLQLIFSCIVNIRCDSVFKKQHSI